MQEVYEDEEELQPVELRRDAHDTHDTEVTLGPMRLVGIFCGLVLVCGLCFGLGYVVGRHKGQQPPPAAAALPADATQTTAAAQTNSPANAAPPKPSAAPQTAPASAPAQQPADGQPETPSGEGPSETNPAASPQSVSPPSGSGSFPAAAAVHPALPQPMQSSPQWMVQIAAGAHREDAQVLAGALRRRGYAVTFRPDPADGLIHVRIGPFSSRREANLMRQRLLNDGYNAIMQP
jgi:cell division septation protein DedD